MLFWLVFIYVLLGLAHAGFSAALTRALGGAVHWGWFAIDVLIWPYRLWQRASR